jgi:hypothetical protein
MVDLFFTFASAFDLFARLRQTKKALQRSAFFVSMKKKDMNSSTGNRRV